MGLALRQKKNIGNDEESESREDKRSTDSNANFVNKLVPVQPMQYNGEQENVHLL